MFFMNFIKRYWPYILITVLIFIGFTAFLILTGEPGERAHVYY